MNPHARRIFIGLPALAGAVLAAADAYPGRASNPGPAPLVMRRVPDAVTLRPEGTYTSRRKARAAEQLRRRKLG